MSKHLFDYPTMVGDEIMATIKGAILAADRRSIKDHIDGVPITPEHDATARFTFNGVTVHVRANSDPVLIHRDWQRAMEGKISGTVGPYPVKELSNPELEADAEIDAQLAERRRQRDAEYTAAQNAREAELKAALDGVGPLVMKDEDAAKEWQRILEINSKDAYSKATVTYAENWGRLMQKEIDQGMALPEIAEDASHVADYDGITGFMYGMAVNLLSNVWIYGDDLRRWHNGNYGHDGDGVVNPAVFTIGEKEETS